MNSARETVHLSLGERSYDILIGPGLIGEAGALLAPHLARPRVAIITDEAVGDLHLSTLEAGLAASGVASMSLALPSGETTKGWTQFPRTVEWLLEQKIERNDLIVAFCIISLLTGCIVLLSSMSGTPPPPSNHWSDSPTLVSAATPSPST